MFLVKRIIVGVEMPAERPWSACKLKAPSRLAVQQAFQVGNGGRVTTILASLLPEPASRWIQSHDDADRQMIQDRAAAAAVLNELREQYASAEKSAKQIECVVRSGDAWEGLIRMAENRPDTLIVCGTRDSGSLRGVLLASTEMKLLRLAPGPVWIVKPPLEDNERTDIVAATDLGPLGADVIRTAVSIASQSSAHLHVVHATQHGADIENVKRLVYEQLAATDYRTIQAGVKVHVSVGDADVCILAAVREGNADLVVLGTSSKTGVAGLLPGSTVERLLPELKCSVLALKPEGFRTMSPTDFWTIQRTHSTN
ncbi:MAG: universal stress protein [Planctomycetota bacterium]|nr:universal stress protein [Planctomycetota bacterium]